MNYKPKVGTGVIMSNSKHGIVGVYSKKPKHADKVMILKDGETGCNSSIMIKCKGLVQA